MISRAVITLVAAAGLSVGLSACGGSTSAVETTAPVPSTSSWSDLTPSASSSSGTSPGSESTTSSSSSSASTEQDADDWGEESQLRAAEKKARPAVRVASDLADTLQTHRKSTKAGWWKKVSPYLSETGKKQLQQKSPASIGYTKVTGKARLLVTDTDMGPRYVSVAVPTDKGTYLFLTEKAGTGSKASWKVASVSKLSGSS